MSEIFTFKKLYMAYSDCRETKRKTINALKFEYNLERNLFQLQRELEAKRYKPGRSICFVVEDPSPREIFAASFKDRIVHHLLIREVEAVGEKCFIFDTFACRKEKGTHLAVKRLKRFVRKAMENSSRPAYYLQLDISGFFMAIDRNILYFLFEKLVLKHNKSQQWKDDILWLAKIIIFHKPTDNYIIRGNPTLFDLIPPRKSLFNSPFGKGMPIGNYSSQFFANIFLNELDQFVKRELKCKYYVRYVDDFILLDINEERLKDFGDKIGVFLKNNLDLKLNHNKTKLQIVSKGIDFLGYFIMPYYILVRQRVIRRLKDKLNGGNHADLKKITAMINSYYGHFRHAFSYNLRKDIYNNHLGTLQRIFLPKANYFCLRYVKKLRTA
ncbi:MAG: RNA-directed DNA polymerase [Candidatus Nealsonbacteria bacterium]|nr:RNA-directed DNA polymerase [Candidatus Nealsonbacteria bacterium]